MNKKLIIGLIVALLLIILLFIVYVLTVNLTKRIAENNRISANNAQLMNGLHTSASLILTLKEARAADSLKIDSLAKALRVRPKTITNIIEVTKTIHDTVIVPVSVETYKDHWVLRDSGNCWSWSAIGRLIRDSLTIERTNFDYKDKMTQIFFWEREKRLWFVHYGKKRYYQSTSSICGSSQVRAISIIKR